MVRSKTRSGVVGPCLCDLLVLTETCIKVAHVSISIVISTAGELTVSVRDFLVPLRRSDFAALFKSPVGEEELLIPTWEDCTMDEVEEGVGKCECGGDDRLDRGFSSTSASSRVVEVEVKG